MTPRRVAFVAAILPAVPGLAQIISAFSRITSYLRHHPGTVAGLFLTGADTGHKHATTEWYPHGIGGEGIRAYCRSVAADLLGDRLQLFLPDTPYDKEVEALVRQQITAFEPDAVIAWLGLGAPMATLPWLYDQHPLAVLQFGDNKVIPCRTDAIGIVHTLRPVDAPSECPRIFIPIAWEIPDRPFLQPRTPPDMRWDVVTVLQWARIESAFAAYSQEEKSALASVFGNVGASWRMIGVERAADIRGADPAFEKLCEAGRWSFARYDDQLDDTFLHARMAFLPPALAGGAGAIWTALRQGVPALVPDLCDAANFVDPDYAYRDAGDMQRKLLRLLTDEDYRLAAAHAQQERLRHHHTSELEGRGIATLAETAFRIGQQRLNR